MKGEAEMIGIISRIRDLLTPKNPLKTAILLYILVLSAYAIFFRDQTVIADSSKWGEFGDFLGGFINPVIGLITVWLLTVSLKQNEDMLLQSQEELRLTTEEMRRGQKIQEATKETLRNQLDISKISTDLTSAKVMIDHYNDQLKLLVGNVHAKPQRRNLDDKIRYLNSFLDSEFSLIVARNIDRKVAPLKEWLTKVIDIDGIRCEFSIDIMLRVVKIKVIRDAENTHKLKFVPDDPIDFNFINFFEGVGEIFSGAERATRALITINKGAGGNEWTLHLCPFLENDNG